MNDLINYQRIMRMLEKATDSSVRELLGQRASYYEKRLGL